MNIFIIISLAAVVYWAIAIYKKPSRWVHFLQYAPIVFFAGYMRMEDMTDALWSYAFSFAGFCAIGAILISIHKRITMDRLFLGVNLFLILGACGFLFNLQPLLEWYGDTTGGPFFTCIFVVGLFTTLFTQSGFIGAKNMSRDAIRYGSFLLLAATLIALVWSVKADDQGILWATAMPFIILRIIQDQIVKHVA